MPNQFFGRQLAVVLACTLFVILLAIAFEPVEVIHDFFHTDLAMVVFEVYKLDDVLFGFFLSMVFITGNWFWQVRRRITAERESLIQHQAYQVLLENLPIAVVTLDADRQVGLSNPLFDQFRRQLGESVLQETIAQLIAKLEGSNEARFSGGKHRYPGAAGQEYCIEWSLNRHTAANQSCYLLLGRDISQHEQMQNKLSIAQKILNHTPVGVMVVNSQAGIEYVNRSFERITGYSAAEMQGRDPSLLNSGRHDADFFAAMYQTLADSGRWQGEIWNRRKNGDIFLEWLSISTLTDEQGEVSHYIGMFSEITAQEHIREKLHTLAYYDALTSLANRTLFNDRLERLIQHRSSKTLCVVFLDLDGFKRINDSLGHDVGDQLLATFAQRLQNNIRNADVVARWGGDEFIIAIEVSDSHRGISRFCNKQLKVLDAPFMLDGRELTLTASVGVSIYGEDAHNASELIRNADIAMYQAKRRGKNRYEIFSAQLHEEIAESIEIENRLRQAIRQRQIDVHFQPQVHINGQVVGLETLARWSDSELGAVSPQKFIKVAEDTGLIGELGEVIVAKAFAQFQPWHDNDPVLTLSVNLSASQLQDDELIAFLQQKAAEHGIDPQQIKLEITEDVFMSDIEKSIHTTAQLKAIGFQISLDDFGTGYSSLSYLKDFDIDELKIDRSFVSSIQTSERNRAVVAAIIVMAEILAIDCIVEGVETEAQLRELKNMGCTLYQGYFFYRPLPAGDVELILNEVSQTVA